MQVAEIASTEVILIVVVVALLVFGSAKIPKIARGLGSAKTEFEKGVKESQTKDETKSTAEATERPDATDKPAG
jgi:sec-independent protein translocase protein TatA